MSSPKVDRALLRECIAGELRAALGRADITQGDLADRTGLARATINRLLGGGRPVEVEVLYTIAAALDEDPGEILDEAKRQYLKKIARRDVQGDG